MQNNIRHASRRGRTSCGVEPMEPRTLLAGTSFGFGDFRPHDLSTSTEFVQRSSGPDSFAARSFDGDRGSFDSDRFKGDWDAAGSMHEQHFQSPVSPFDRDSDSTTTLAVVPAAADDSSADGSAGTDDSVGFPSHGNFDRNGSSFRDSDRDYVFDWAVVVNTPGMSVVVTTPRFDFSPRGNGNNFGQRGNRNPDRGNNNSPLPRQENSQTSARPGQAVVDAADPSVAAPAASEALQLASAAVAKSIFSNDPIVPHAATYGSTPAAMAPVATTPSADPAGRSILLYLSTTTAGAKPILAAAKVAAVQAVGENVVHAAEAGTELAMASAVTILPNPYRAAEIVRMGSPMMLVADSIGAFIEESVNMASIVTRETPPNNRRAWLVTGAVVAADLALLTYCFYRRRQLQLVEAVVARRICR